MKIIPKPEGFDLRAARADKAGDGRLWKPDDALYDAYQQMQTQPANVALLIGWYHRVLPSGNLMVKFRIAYEHDRQGVALAADLLKDIQT